VGDCGGIGVVVVSGVFGVAGVICVVGTMRPLLVLFSHGTGVVGAESFGGGEGGAGDIAPQVWLHVSGDIEKLILPSICSFPAEAAEPGLKGLPSRLGPTGMGLSVLFGSFTPLFEGLLQSRCLVPRIVPGLKSSGRSLVLRIRSLSGTRSLLLDFRRNKLIGFSRLSFSFLLSLTFSGLSVEFECPWACSHCGCVDVPFAPSECPIPPTDVMIVSGLAERGVDFGGALISDVRFVNGVEIREPFVEVGAGVALAVEGAGGGGIGGATALSVFVSNHCPREPRSGEPMSSGGSADRVGAAPVVGGDGAMVG
jgi:hypothetical protein